MDETKEDFDRVEAMKPVKVASDKDTIEADMILNLLKNNDIPCFKKDNGTGSYMNLYLGFSVFGEEIYVDECDNEKALKLIGELFSEKNPKIGTDPANKMNNTFSAENEINTIDTVNADRKGSLAATDNEDEKNPEENEVNIEDVEDDSYKDYAFYRNPHSIVRIYLIAMIIIFVMFFLIVRMKSF
jgi:hypothetical protein